MICTYFTNSAKGIYGRNSINADGTTAGNAVVLAQASYGVWDAFDRDFQGDAWITTHPNLMNEVANGGAQRNISGGAGSFVQPSSARFGRGARTNILYVAIAGIDIILGQIALSRPRSFHGGGSVTCSLIHRLTDSSSISIAKVRTSIIEVMRVSEHLNSYE